MTSGEVLHHSHVRDVDQPREDEEEDHPGEDRAVEEVGPQEQGRVCGWGSGRGFFLN